MKKALALFALLLSSSAVSAQTQPAQMGITPATSPEVLQVLDNTKTWVPIGSVNSTTHGFSPIGASGGTLPVTDPSVGMAHGGADNSPLLSTLMNALGPASANGGSTEVIFPGVTDQQYTPYFFSKSLSISRNARYRCGSGRQGANGVELVFAAGVQGVVQEDAAFSADGQYGGGWVEGCTIVSLGFGTAVATPSSSSITGVSMRTDLSGAIPPTTWHVGDGVVMTPEFPGTYGADVATPTVAPGAYVSAVSGSTLTLASGYTTGSDLPGAGSEMVVIQLPAALKFTVQTTAGSNSMLVSGGPRLLVPGEVLWSDAFPFGSTVFSVSGALGNQTVNMVNAFVSAAQNATVTHGSGSPGQLWVMPAALKRDTTANSSGNITIGWPFGLEMSCGSGAGLNCTGSYDDTNFYQLGLFGRWVAGNNYSASSSINEKGARNFMADFMNGGTLGEVDVNFNANSEESGSSLYSILGNCTNQNSSVMLGGYIYTSHGGCANSTSVFPPTPGSPWLVVGPQAFIPAGTPAIANGPGTGVLQNVWQATSGSNCVGFNSGPYLLSFSYNQCGTPSTMGFAWNASVDAFVVSVANEGSPSYYFSSTYLGYNPVGSGVAFPYGVELGNPDSYVGQERLLDSGVTLSNQPHLQGDIRLQPKAVAGGALGSVSTPSFTTTLAGAVTAGSTTSVAVAACPSPALPAGVTISAVDNHFAPPVDVDQVLGTLASCVGTTLTLSAASAFNSANGTTIQFLQWRPAARIANDVAGTSWLVANVTDIADLVACSAKTIGFGVVNNGVAVGTGGYGATVGATGSSTRPVFCDGASWTYH